MLQVGANPALNSLRGRKQGELLWPRLFSLAGNFRQWNGRRLGPWRSVERAHASITGQLCLHAVEGPAHMVAHDPAHMHLTLAHLHAQTQELNTEAPTDVEYDAIIIGSGVGGLTAAAQMVANGAKVLVLEK